MKKIAKYLKMSAENITEKRSAMQSARVEAEMLGIAVSAEDGIKRICVALSAKYLKKKIIEKKIKGKEESENKKKNKSRKKGILRMRRELK